MPWITQIPLHVTQVLIVLECSLLYDERKIGKVLFCCIQVSNRKYFNTNRDVM